jgi:hypothetical protein
MGKVQWEALPDRVTIAWLLSIRLHIVVEPRFVYCVTNYRNFTASQSN